MSVPLEKVEKVKEKVELTPEEMDAQAVLKASQKLAEFFQGQMIDLGEKQTSQTAILIDQKVDIVDKTEDDNFIEPDEIEEDNYDDF